MSILSVVVEVNGCHLWSSTTIRTLPNNVPNFEILNAPSPYTFCNWQENQEIQCKLLKGSFLGLLNCAYRFVISALPHWRNLVERLVKWPFFRLIKFWHVFAAIRLCHQWQYGHYRTTFAILQPTMLPYFLQLAENVTPMKFNSSCRKGGF